MSNSRSGAAADRWFSCGHGFQIHRRYEQPKRRKEAATEDEPSMVVETNIADISDKDPPGRLAWVESALIQTARGKLKASTVCDIIEDRSFAAGMDGTVGIQINELLHSNMHLFNSQQQKRLSLAFDLNKWIALLDETDEMEYRASSATSGSHERRRRGDLRGTAENGRRLNRNSAIEEREEWRRPREDDRRRSDARAEEEHKERRRKREDEDDSSDAHRQRRKRRRRRDDEKHEDSSEPADESKTKMASSGDLAGHDNSSSGIEVWEEKRQEAIEASASLKLLDNVLGQIRTVGLHVRETWNAGELATCNARVKSLRLSLLTDEQNKDFEIHWSSFQARKESSTVFLQYVLDLFQTLPSHAAESDVALFLSLLTVLLQNKVLRSALHDRALTVKKKLEEGSLR